MTRRKQLRAVRRAISLAEGLLGIFAAVADELAAVQDEIAAAATLEGAKGELASAKDSVEAALAALRQWVMDVEVDEDGEAGE
jgi:hypothetical protein